MQGIWELPSILNFYKLAHNGRPVIQRQRPQIACTYWNMHDELTSDDSLLSKGSQISILITLWDSFQCNLHEEHAGINTCQLMACLLIYWPSIDQDHMYYVKECPTHIKQLPSQPGEPLINHEVPHCPWQKLSTNFMDWDGKRYLLITAYFFEITIPLPDVLTTTNTAIGHLSELFCLEGIWQENCTDNGLPFHSKVLICWQIWLQAYNFKPILHHIQWLHRESCWKINNGLSIGKAWRIPIPQVIMKLWQTHIGTNLPGPTEILHNWSEGPCTP